MNRQGSSAIEAEPEAATPPAGLGARFRAWSARNMPTRESFESNRFLRPVAHRVLHPALWRFTRRSVPRGVALGVVTGILVPMGQIPASAVLAPMLRANIPSAALTTFVTNPITTPPLWVAAYWVGSWLLGYHAAGAHPGAVPQGWTQWLLTEAGPATATGLLVITAIGAVLGYAITAVSWRLWIARKWKGRTARRSISDVN